MQPWEEMATNLLGKFWAGKMLAAEVSDILTIWSQNRVGKNAAKAYSCAIEAFLFEAPLFNTFPESQKNLAFELLELLGASTTDAAHAKAIQDAKAAAAKGAVPIVTLGTLEPQHQNQLLQGWGDRVRQNLPAKAPVVQETESAKAPVVQEEESLQQKALSLKLVPAPPGLQLPADAFVQLPPGLDLVKDEGSATPASRSATPVSPFRGRRAGGRGRRV